MQRTLQAFRLGFMIIGITVLLLITAQTLAFGAETLAPELSAQEVLNRYISSINHPYPKQWRVSLKVDWNGLRIGNGVIGWDEGMKASASFGSPFLGDAGSVGFAFRPSGFALMKTGVQERVYADIVPYAHILALAPRVFNKSLMAGMSVELMGEPRLIGQTSVEGRPAYILETTYSTHGYVNAITNTISRLLADEAIANLLDTLGVSPANVMPVLDQVFAESLSGIPLATRNQGLYIDAKDFIVIKYDLDSLAKQWQQAFDSLGLSGAVPPMPELRVDKIKTGDDGHIQSLTYSIHWNLATESLIAIINAVEAAKAAQEGNLADFPDLENLPMALDELESIVFGFSATLERKEGLYLTTLLEGTARFEMRPQSEEEFDSSLDLALEHNMRIALSWDFTKGADPKLIDNMKLVNAEQYWGEALLALQNGDYEAAISPLERLISVAPTFKQALDLLGNSYYATGRVAQAADTYAKLLKLQPKNLTYMNSLAYIYINDEVDLEQGLKIATEAYELAGDEADATLLDTLAWGYYMNNMLNEAEERAFQAVELGMTAEDESLVIYYYHLAVILLAQEKYSAAKEALIQAEALQPDLIDFESLYAEIEEMSQD